MYFFLPQSNSLSPYPMTLCPSNPQGQQESPPQWRGDPWCWNQNSLFLIPTTSQDINYYCVILSLNLPTDVESGLLEGVNCRTACAQLVSVTPGLWLWDESDLSSHKSSVPTRVFAYPSSWLSTKPWDQRGLSLPSFPRWGIQALWECVPCREPQRQKGQTKGRVTDFWSGALPVDQFTR